MLINFEAIPHKRQRYETVGDYYRRGSTLVFRISRMKDKRYVVLVFLHEIIEYFVARLQGVKLRDIDKFDMAYERARAADAEKAPCGCTIQDEPGDDIHCPVYRAHQVATQCEMAIAKALDVDWLTYCKTVDAL